jgi:hypothetical protein
MISLEKSEAGRSYRVTWMLGEYADYLKKTWNLSENDVMRVLSNNGSAMIVTFKDRKLAMSADVARSVKLEAITA